MPAPGPGRARRRRPPSSGPRPSRGRSRGPPRRPDPPPDRSTDPAGSRPGTCPRPRPRPGPWSRPMPPPWPPARGCARQHRGWATGRTGRSGRGRPDPPRWTPRPCTADPPRAPGRTPPGTGPTGRTRSRRRSRPDARRPRPAPPPARPGWSPAPARRASRRVRRPDRPDHRPRARPRPGLGAPPRCVRPAPPAGSAVPSTSLSTSSKPTSCGNSMIGKPAGRPPRAAGRHLIQVAMQLDGERGQSRSSRAATSRPARQGRRARVPVVSNNSCGFTHGRMSGTSMTLSRRTIRSSPPRRRAPVRPRGTAPVLAHRHPHLISPKRWPARRQLSPCRHPRPTAYRESIRRGRWPDGKPSVLPRRPRWSSHWSVRPGR